MTSHDTDDLPGVGASDAAAADERRLADILKAQGWGFYRAAFTHGRHLFETSLETFRQAAAIYRDLGDQAGLAGALAGEATVLRSTGDPAAIRQALDLYRQEIELLRGSAAEEALPEGLINLALASRDLVTADQTATWAFDGGVTACREAITIANSKGNSDSVALANSTLADLCLVMARLDQPAYRETHLKEALGFYGQALRLWEARDQDGAILAKLGLAEAYIELERNLEGARDLLAEVLDYYTAYTNAPVSGPVRYQIAQVKELEARLLLAEGRPDEAEAKRQEARDQLEALGFQP